MSKWVNPEDFRNGARQWLPKFFFDYLDGAAGDERTAAENVADFDKIKFLPRILGTTSGVTPAAAFLGGRHRLPLMLGPVGSLGQFRAHAELTAFKLAKRYGVPACLSSFATVSPEHLEKHMPEGAGFQLYVLKDFDRTQKVMERVHSAGIQNLFVTVDTRLSGIRERDIKNGLRQNTRLALGNLLDMAAKPRWLFDMAKAQPVRLTLAEGWRDAGSGYMSQAAFLAQQIDPNLTWEKISRIRTAWPGRLVIKGVLRSDDLRQAIDLGADGVVISNHGGRQLDGCPSTISVLSSLRDIPSDFEVILDGGIRRGVDIVKAIGLGATACSLGRTYAYALAAAGEAGLQRLLECIQTEITTTLGLLGVQSIAELRDRGRKFMTISPDL